MMCVGEAILFQPLTLNLYLQAEFWSVSNILATPLGPYNSSPPHPPPPPRPFAKLPAPAASSGGCFHRAAKLVLTSARAYLGFPVGPAGWGGRRIVEGCSPPGQQWRPSVLEWVSLHNLPVSELGPVGMKWEVERCSEEGKTRASWPFLEHLEEFKSETEIAVFALFLTSQGGGVPAGFRCSQKEGDWAPHSREDHLTSKGVSTFTGTPLGGWVDFVSNLATIISPDIRSA